MFLLFLACAPADSDSPADSADTGTPASTTSGESPRVCSEEECPGVANARGSTTRTLTLAAQGTVREFEVDGGSVSLNVSLYNDSLPGPTVEVWSGTTTSDVGDVLVLDVTNNGDLNTCCWQECGDPTRPESCWAHYCQELPLEEGGECIAVDEPTNIHTHGLHMAGATSEGGPADVCLYADPDPANPNLPWDNVFVTIPASGDADQMSCATDMCMSSGNQQAFMYPLAPQTELSDFQPSAVVKPHWFGLQWYHPHMHEASRDQVGRGLAGALIVRNPVESTIPAIAGISAESERVLVLQGIPLDDGSEPPDRLRLVNGKVKPALTARAGETQRWRVLNATSDSAVQLSVLDAGGAALPYFPIGFDGVPTPTVRPAISREWIGPGSRREVLLTVPQSAAVGDVYSVTWCEPATDIFHSPTDELQPDETCNGTSQVVATLSVVEGEGKSAEFGEGDTFADLEGFGLAADLWAQPADVYRTIKFTQEFSVAEGTKFMIDVGDGEGSRQFEMDEICDPPIEATLGSVEEWTIENWTTDLHTFHMHVVPFQVDPASMSSRYGSGAFYQDNVILPLGESANNPTNPNEARSPGVLKLRMRHDDYVGTSVFHCHLLEHEDYGMMTAVSVRAE